jgi:integrase
VIEFKAHISLSYSARGVNGIIAAVNGLLENNGCKYCQVKGLKVQPLRFVEQDREITRDEAERLIDAAVELGRERSAMFIRTMLATGIRVSELRFITVEALKNGLAEVQLKGKVRGAIIQSELCMMLMDYAQRSGIVSGSVFITRNGKPLDRSYIWKEMKSLAKHAEVAASKVFPHALRHCFARVYNVKYPNCLAELADILGHSSIETTRVYTAATVDSHRVRVESLALAA